MDGLISQLTPFQAAMMVLILWVSTTLGTHLLLVYSVRNPGLIEKTLTFGAFAIGLIMGAVIVLAGMGV